MEPEKKLGERWVEFLNTESGFSKAISAMILICLPFVGFGLGIKYKEAISEVSKSILLYAKQDSSEVKVGQEESASLEVNVLRIISEFAQKSWKEVLPNYDNKAGELLTAVVMGMPTNTGEVQRLMKVENSKSFADAPEMRAGYENWIKLCVADSFINRDLKNTLKRCRIKDNYPNGGVWEKSDRDDYLSAPDDITSAAQVMPYMLTGYAYYKSGDINKTKYYWEQVIDHQRREEAQYGKNNDGLYQEIMSVVDTSGI